MSLPQQDVTFNVPVAVHLPSLPEDLICNNTRVTGWVWLRSDLYTSIFFNLGEAAEAPAKAI